MHYLVSIGLEVHVQLTTSSKMFCACPVEYGAEPNEHTCPVCLGLPGAMPVLNQKAIEKTLLTGLMLGCSSPEISKWDRKNYFYPDMPKDYQLSQYDLPLCLGGGVPLYNYCYPKDHQKHIASPGKVISLTRIHLEEDVGKSTHLANHSLIDFNRAGTPLMEIVSEPEIESAEETVAYLNSLRQILLYGGVSDADMEKGQMRCDVNVSLRPASQQELGTKVELKNMNSPGAVRRALHYEIARQAECLERGEKIQQCTRRWNDDLGETAIMRTKEDAHDYRYFPEPDLLPIRTSPILERIRDQVPELPHQKAARFESQFQISPYDASVLSSDQNLAHYFESAVQNSPHGKKIANWVINNLLGLLNDQSLHISDCPIPPATLAHLVDLVESGQLSTPQGKEVFEALLSEPGKSPQEIADAKGFKPADTSEIENLINEAIAANPEKVAEIQSGNEKLLNWLTGQVMKASKGQANPKVIGEVLRKKLFP